jgi:ribosomal protein S18 acetylase RimI-like enzyme
MNTIDEYHQDVLLAPFTHTGPNVRGAAAVYAATWPGDLDEIRAFITRNAMYPDFCGQVALRANRAIGMGFGHCSRSGDWWHDRVVARLGSEHAALQDSWVLVGLAILEEDRGKGSGTMLLGALLQSQPCPRALLSTEVKNAGAGRFYEGQGWEYVETHVQFHDGGEPFVIMSHAAR